MGGHQWENLSSFTSQAEEGRELAFSSHLLCLALDTSCQIEPYIIFAEIPELISSLNEAG